MSDSEQPQLTRALQAIKDLRTRLEEIERGRREPIAIIGLACRFPGGADSPEALWGVLQNRVDGIVPVPIDRWDSETLFNADPMAQGKVATRWGGFLPNIDGFDAPFFGISPREAIGMDPQQRLLLEVAWEAFEDAGETLEHLSGSHTGVFIGVHSHSNDYYMMQASGIENIDVYTGTGTSHSVVSGRLSYLFDLRGPNIALDTACSSSLVAVHMACQSLRSGESDLALAGGVNVMLTPHFTMVASRMRMMAGDGRCKTFDADADGFVRSEGCGAIVLKRLSNALADGDQILALIRGSAINQDGHTNGLTAPNGLSQQAVIRQALANAGLKPDQISFVETHGTGTPLGDPIEVEALGAVYGKPREDGLPCVLGSIKTNVGHMEGAAGIGGLIKTVLALQHAAIPPNLHFKQLNPHISLEGTRLVVATEIQPWITGTERRFAGVSSFGWSGTNAHIVLEEAPDLSGTQLTANSTSEFRSPVWSILPISARSQEALTTLAHQYRELVGASATPSNDLCYSASTRRNHHDYRLAVVGRSTLELTEALDAFLQGETHPLLSFSHKPENFRSGLVFVFPGQGSQWVGMGRKLLDLEPAFHQAMEKCERAIQPYIDWNLIEQLTADESSSRMEEIDVIQPILFALQVALAEWWRSQGVTPDAVVGHSMGEIAAAYVAGSLTLEDAARIICLRSRLMRRVSGKGAMAVVGLSIEETQALLLDKPDRLSVAVSNSPTSTVLSGDPDALDEVIEKLRFQNIFYRPVKVDVAAHSPQMEPLWRELVAGLGSIQPKPTSVPLYSTVTAGPVAGPSLDAAYWGRNLREPVLFSSAVSRLLADSYNTFVEISPHPILLAPIEQTHASSPQPAQLATLASMRRGEDEQATLYAALGGLYTAGYQLDWKKLYPFGGRPATLPAYPWQRKRYWVQIKQDYSDPLAHWFYQVVWRLHPRPQNAARRPTRPGTWLIFSGQPEIAGLGVSLANSIRESGEQCILVYPGESYSRPEKSSFTVDPHIPEHFKLLIADTCGIDPAACRGVVYLWGLEASSAGDLTAEGLLRAQELGCGGALHLVQALEKTHWQSQGAPRLWLVTQEAQSVADSNPEGLAQAPLWGLGRVIAFEHPELWGGLIDLEQAPGPDQAAQLLEEIFNPDEDNQIAYRQGQRFIAQLERQESVPHVTGNPRVRPDCSYLITGGLGGLGLKVAGWLVEHGARHIALMGRSRGSSQAREIAQAFELSGVQVLLVQGDAGRAEDVTRILAEIAQGMPPLRGIVHTAGIVDDAPLSHQSWSSFERVMDAKVLGAWNLHTFTKELFLDWFVLFSSASSLLGIPGQGNYAAANAFLDALAHKRLADGQTALTINWGAWMQVGLAAQGERLTRLDHLGIEGFSPEKGLEAFGRVLSQNFAQVAVIAMNWSKFLDQLSGGNRTGFFAGLKPKEDLPLEENQPTGRSALAQELEAIAPEARLNQLRVYVRKLVAGVLRFENIETLSMDQGFFQMGMDSLMAVELKNRLQSSLGCALRSTLAFDYPSVNLLSGYLLSELFSEQTLASPASEKAPAEDEKSEGFQDLTREEVKALLDEELRSLSEDY